VLPDIDPVNNCAVPPEPVVKTGDPEIIILLLAVVIPIAKLDPAFKTIALDVVLPTVMFSPKVKFPDVVEALKVESDVLAPMLPPDNINASDVVIVKA